MTKSTNNTWHWTIGIRTQLASIGPTTSNQLVCFINFQLTQDDDGHSIKDSSDVGQHPQEQGEFEWVDEILNQEQTTKFSDVSVDMGDSNASDLLNLFRWESQIDVQELSARDDKMS